MLSISIGPVPISDKERVVGFKLNIKAGRIANLEFIPPGWNITIDNDPSWNATIVGSSMVGSAAIDIKSLDDFVVVEKYEFMGLNFVVEAEIVVTQDFEKERQIHLKTEDLVIKRLQRTGSGLDIGHAVDSQGE